MCQVKKKKKLRNYRVKFRILNDRKIKGRKMTKTFHVRLTKSAAMLHEIQKVSEQSRKVSN
jgi:hypothetical protein